MTRGAAAASDVRHGQPVLVLDQLVEDPAHRDAVVVGVRREDDDARCPRQLAAPADAGAEGAEHEAVHRAWRAVPREQRGEPVLGVVAVRQLEDAAPDALAEPDDSAHDQLGGPGDLVDEPRGWRRASARRRRRGRRRRSRSGGAAGRSRPPRRRSRPRRRTARTPCARRWRGGRSRAPSRMVATPIVIASRGTYSSPKTSAAASSRVTRSRCTSRVRLPAPEPGSLQPMCPVLPMPSSGKSMLPARAIAASSRRTSSSTSSRGRSPRRTWTSAGSMST